MNKLTQILTGITAGAALYFAPVPATAQVISGDSTAGTVFLQRCEPGKTYTVNTEDDQTVELVCPSKKKQKKSCESQFDGNGFCAGKNLASALGLGQNTYVKNLCPGESYCYDASGVNFSGRIVSLEGKVLDLGERMTVVEDRVKDTNSRVHDLETDRLSEVERFAVTLAGKQCQVAYDRINSEIADYKTKVGELRTAETALQDYSASLSIPTESAKLTPRDLLAKELTSEKSVVDKKMAADLLKKVDEAEKAAQKAEKTMLDDKKNLEERGCYNPKPVDESNTHKRDVEYVARALGVADLESNLGGMVEFGAMVPAGRSFYLGPVVRAGYLGTSDSDSDTREFPTATEYINQTQERNLFGGASLVAGFNVFEDALALELEAGASLSQERTTRTMTVGTDTRTYDSGNTLGVTPVVGAGLNGKFSDRFGWSAKTLYEPVKESLQFLAGLGVYF